ncbi:MAG: type II toxin-antitoxin system BrnA family antitoxin, partial [Sphaerospermopsis kisseleviana]
TALLKGEIIEEYADDRRGESCLILEFDTKFDNDEDITEFLDLYQARRPSYEQKRVNIDFPVWMIEALEKEAKRLGVTSDSIIKLWLAERLDKKVITG